MDRALALLEKRLQLLRRRVDQMTGGGGGGPATGAIGFSISPDGNLRCGYAGAAPNVLIDGNGRLQLEV